MFGVCVIRVPYEPEFIWSDKSAVSEAKPTNIFILWPENQQKVYALTTDFSAFEMLWNERNV